MKRSPWLTRRVSLARKARRVPAIRMFWFDRNARIGRKLRVSFGVRFRLGANLASVSVGLTNRGGVKLAEFLAASGSRRE